MPDFGKEDFYEEIEAEAELVREFLEGDYDGLNGLLLVSRALEGGLQISLEEEVPYYSHIYQDTGLPVICAGSRLLRVPGEAYVLICGPVTGLRSAVAGEYDLSGYDLGGGEGTAALCQKKGYFLCECFEYS